MKKGRESETRERGSQESYSVMSLSGPFNELNMCLNSSDVRKTSSIAVPGLLKGFAKKQKIGGRSSVALSDAVPQSVAVRAPVDVSAVDHYLAGGQIRTSQTDRQQGVGQGHRQVQREAVHTNAQAREAFQYSAEPADYESQ